jgi:hypothetical protein
MKVAVAKKIIKIIFGQRSIIYGLLYLLLIPLYAFIYYNLPNQFYKSTNNIEKLKGVFQKKNPLEYTLTDQIGEILYKGFIDRYKRDYLITKFGDTLRNIISTYSADDYTLEVNGDWITIPILIKVVNKDTVYEEGYLGFKNNEQYAIDVPLRFRANEYSQSTDSRTLFLDTNSHYYNKKVLDSNKIGYDFRKLFEPYEVGGNYDNHVFMAIRIDDALQRDINSLVYGLNGKNFYSDYWNLFYFSAVTITTLGYGDIVPITSNARLWVSSEAILGIIIIGLFLNSVSKNIGVEIRK